MITIMIQSGDAEDIFLTVVDNNVAPPRTVLTRKRFPVGSPATAVQVQESGSSNKCDFDWEAERCSDPNRRKSRNEVRDDGDLVYVDAG